MHLPRHKEHYSIYLLNDTNQTRLFTNVKRDDLNQYDKLDYIAFQKGWDIILNMHVR